MPATRDGPSGLPNSPHAISATTGYSPLRIAPEAGRTPCTLYAVRHLDREYRIEKIWVHPAYRTGAPKRNDADVNLSNDNGDTPLIDAAYLVMNEILCCLLESGARLEHRNTNGQSAVDRARSKGNTKAISLLESHGAGRRSD